jgi:hypothetical protein
VKFISAIVWPTYQVEKLRIDLVSLRRRREMWEEIGARKVGSLGRKVSVP